MRTLCACVIAGLAATTAAGDVYTVDFFPKQPQVNHILQLRFIGPGEGTITGARLVLDFTTLEDFQAQDLTLLLVAAVDPVNPDGGFWFITGTDLGWQGQGRFLAGITTDDLNGIIQPGLWGFDLGSGNDPPAYSGLFSKDSRLDITIAPACYPDCNGDGVLNLSDFGCFTTRFALGEPDADCNGDKVLNLSDFGCFTTKFALGCP